MQVYIYFLGSTFQHKHYCFLCRFPDISYQAGNVCAFFFTFLHVKSFIMKKPHILTYEQKVKIWYQQNCFKAPNSFTTGRVTVAFLFFVLVRLSGCLQQWFLCSVLLNALLLCMIIPVQSCDHLTGEERAWCFVFRCLFTYSLFALCSSIIGRIWAWDYYFFCKFVISKVNSIFHQNY